MIQSPVKNKILVEEYLIEAPIIELIICGNIETWTKQFNIKDKWMDDVKEYFSTLIIDKKVSYIIKITLLKYFYNREVVVNYTTTELTFQHIDACIGKLMQYVKQKES